MSKLLAKIYSFFFPLWRRLLNRPRWFSRLKMKSRLIGPAGINPTYGLISSGQTGLLTPSCSWLVWFELVDKVSGNLLRACHDGLQSCSWRICAIVCQHVMLQECEFVFVKGQKQKIIMTSIIFEGLLWANKSTLLYSSTFTLTSVF